MSSPAAMNSRSTCASAVMKSASSTGLRMGAPDGEVDLLVADLIQSS